MKPTSKSIRQKELFRNFDQFINSANSLNEKRNTTPPNTPSINKTTSLHLNKLSLLETDIYILSFKKNEIKVKKSKLEQKLKKLQQEFSHLKEKFVDAAESLSQITKSINKMKATENRRRLFNKI